MKSLLSNKRNKAILSIGLVAISIGAISKKVIRYPTKGCIKGEQELTLKNVIKNQSRIYTFCIIYNIQTTYILKRNLFLEYTVQIFISSNFERFFI